MNEVVLKIENLSKKFKQFIAVNEINLEVNKGETVGFVGPNGAGKTTGKILIQKKGEVYMI